VLACVANEGKSENSNFLTVKPLGESSNSQTPVTKRDRLNIDQTTGKKTTQANTPLLVKKDKENAPNAFKRTFGQAGLAEHHLYFQ
jgi:hypothetical protein